MSITKLSISNLKRISVAEIEPDGSAVLITGANATGKSSCLDAIAYLLGGQRLVPNEPIKRGENEATVEAEFDNGIKVKRTWSFTKDDKLKSSVEIFTADGGKLGSPQKFLDERFGALTFDPSEFIRMDAKKQRKALLGILGVEDQLTKLDGRHRAAFDERAFVNRDVNNLRSQLDGMAVPPADTPDEPVSVGKLAELLSIAMQNNEAIKAQMREAERLGVEIGQLETELASKKIMLESFKDVSLTPRDTLAIQAQIDQAETVNKAVAVKAERMKRQQLAAAADDRVDQLEASLSTIDEERVALLANAKFPVEGLGFAEDGVTYGPDHLPFAQASQSEQLRVSLAIAIALHPEVKKTPFGSIVLNREGSFCDAASIKAIAEHAKSCGAQVWIEMVDESGSGIVFEDGMVLAAPDGE